MCYLLCSSNRYPKIRLLYWFILCILQSLYGLIFFQFIYIYIYIYIDVSISIFHTFSEYKQNSIPVNQDTKQCVDNDMPDPVNQEYNMPHFDLIF